MFEYVNCNSISTLDILLLVNPIFFKSPLVFLHNCPIFINLFSFNNSIVELDITLL